MINGWSHSAPNNNVEARGMRIRLQPHQLSFDCEDVTREIRGHHFTGSMDSIVLVVQLPYPLSHSPTEPE